MKKNNLFSEKALTEKVNWYIDTHLPNGSSEEKGIAMVCFEDGYLHRDKDLRALLEKDKKKLLRAWDRTGDNITGGELRYCEKLLALLEKEEKARK